MLVDRSRRWCDRVPFAATGALALMLCSILGIMPSEFEDDAFGL